MQSMTATRSAIASPRALLLALALPLLGACAPVMRRPADRLTTVSARDAAGETGRVLWVRASAAAPGRIVVSGTPLEIRSGGRLRKGDTVYVDAPFAVTLPAEAFEMRIAAERIVSGLRPPLALAHVEFTRVSASGRIETVRAEGHELVLRRAAPGEPLELVGATRRVATPVAE